MEPFYFKIHIICLTFFAIISGFNTFSQTGCVEQTDCGTYTGNCHPDVPTYIADFTGNPDSLWCSPQTERKCQCCGVSENYTCLQFFFTMDPNAEMVRFFPPTSPPWTSGISIYVDCQATPYTWGDTACLNYNGVGPYQISVCQSGGDPVTQFCIQSITKQRLFDDDGWARFFPVFEDCKTSGPDSMQIPFVPFTFDTLTNFTLTFGDAYACINDTLAADSSSLWTGGSIYVCDAAVSGPIWYPGDTIWHTYDSLGWYLFYLTQDKAGCEMTISGKVINNKAPTAMFSAFNTTGCHPLTVYFSNQSCGGFSYLWDFGDGDTSLAENPVHTFNNISNSIDSVYIIKLVITDSLGFKDSITQNITVYPKPSAQFTVDADSGIVPFTVTITNLSLNADKFFWDFGDIGYLYIEDTIFTHIFKSNSCNTSNQTMRLIAQSSKGCNDIISQGITILPVTAPDFLILPDTICCHPFTVSFLSCGAKSCQWDFGDGSLVDTICNTTHTFTNFLTTNDTVYTVNLITEDSSGIFDTISKNIYVKPMPIADFSVSDTVLCSPFTITINNLSTPSSGLNYFWLFGDSTYDTTSTLNLTHTYINLTLNSVTYTLTLIVTNGVGCSDTISRDIIVYPEITANFTVTPDSTGCPPLIANFVNLSLGTNLFFWEFGDGDTSTLQNPIHTYDSSGIFKACLTVINICLDSNSICDTIIISYPFPVSSFSYTDSSLTVSFSDSSTGATSWLWDFGDGKNDTIQNPIHTYTDTGFYNVCLTVYNNCSSDTLCKIIRIDSVVTNIKEYLLKKAVKIYPNPNNGNFQINYQLSEGQKGELTIFNIMGKKLFTYPLVNETDNLKISKSDVLKNGLYFYQIVINNHIVTTEKLLIMTY